MPKPGKVSFPFDGDTLKLLDLMYEQGWIGTLDVRLSLGGLLTDEGIKEIQPFFDEAERIEQLFQAAAEGVSRL